ncbi:MAG: beta-galactosidase [Phycisphaerae bacterium SM23_33]|nr:MAG: beta-galactosidase [Phycisphaerae bacterium SM23_33]
MARRGAIPRAEHPRPQRVREDWLCLNGPWRFAEDAGRNGEALGWPRTGRLTGKITVPFAPESRLSGVGRRDFMPCVWYARSFTLPPAWKGRRILLHFGAVDYEATVWVNGRPAGFHRGGYTPFALEITGLLEPGPNLLVVRAVDDNRGGLQPCGKQSASYDSRGCHYTRVTGIWQSVWLEPVGRSYVKSLRMVGDPAGGRIHLQAEIDSPHPNLTLAVEVRAGRRVVGRAPAAECAVGLDYVRRWDLDDPFLYGVQLTLRDGAGVVDRLGSYFGLRTVTLAPPAILLNERPVFQRLVLDQGYYPAGLYTAPRDADLKRDIVAAQRLGFNGARLHQKVFEPRFLYWADRLGYLIWGEFGDWGMDRDSGEAMRRMAAEWVQVIQRDFNHPCIVGWCPFNEGRPWRDPQMQRDLYRLTKALDPTRAVIDSSGYPHTRTDVYDCHSYEQDPRKFKALFADFAAGGEPFYNRPGQVPFAGQPFFVSEYGGIWWNPGQSRGDAAWGYGDRPRSRAEFIQRYGRLTTALLKHPRMCGFCYTQLYDIEQEVNGLMTYERKMKFDPAVIAAINTQVAAIEKAAR